MPKLLERLERAPELANVSTNFVDSGLTVQIDIDRDTAARFGVTAATIDNALYDAFGQRIISTIYTQSNQYRVIMEGDPKLQSSIESLNDIYVPSGTSAGGGQVPLGSIARISVQAAPLEIDHLGQFPVGHVFLRCCADGLAGKRGGRDPRRRASTSACRSASRPRSKAPRSPSSRRCATRCC